MEIFNSFARQALKTVNEKKSHYYKNNYNICKIACNMHEVNGEDETYLKIILRQMSNEG